MIAFAEPVALLALLALVPVLAAVAHGAARHRAADAAFGGDPALRRGRSPRRNFLRTSMLVAAMALLAVAVARPQWGDADRPVTRRGIDVVIALDVSRSMTATDIAPTRAGAAAAGLRDMLDHLRGDRVGLVTFAGNAFVRSPLTLDLDAVRQLVSQAQEEPALVRPGTNLGGALLRAIRLLDIDDPAETQAIVLVSDGEDLASSQLDAALRAARAEDIRIYTAAAGTAAGADISRDSSGGTEVSRLDRAILRRIADETGGDLREVNTIAGLAVEFARLRQSEFEAAEQPAPVERFQWFVGAALLLLLAQAFVATGSRPAPLRVGRITLGSAALLAWLVLVACGGSAAYGHNQSGNDAYEAGHYDEALSSYRSAAEAMPDEPEISYNIGNTLHQLRRYEEATVASEETARRQTTRGCCDSPPMRSAATPSAAMRWRRPATPSSPCCYATRRTATHGTTWRSCCWRWRRPSRQPRKPARPATKSSQTARRNRPARRPLPGGRTATTASRRRRAIPRRATPRETATPCPANSTRRRARPPWSRRSRHWRRRSMSLAMRLRSTRR